MAEAQDPSAPGAAGPPPVFPAPAAPVSVTKVESENLAAELGMTPEPRLALHLTFYLYALACPITRLFVLLTSHLPPKAFSSQYNRASKLDCETPLFKLLTSRTARWFHMETWVKESSREYVMERIAAVTDAATAAGFENASPKVASLRFPRGASPELRKKFGQMIVHRRTIEERAAKTRAYNRQNHAALAAKARERRANKDRATNESDDRRRGNVYLGNHPRMQAFGPYEYIDFGALQLSNPSERASQLVPHGHFFPDVFGRMLYSQESPDAKLALQRARLLRSAAEIVLDPNLRARAELTVATLKDLRIDPQAQEVGAVPPEVAVINFRGCINRPSVDAVVKAFGPDILSRCIFGLSSAASRHVVVLEGLRRADAAVDLDEMRRLGAAGFTKQGVLRALASGRDPFDARAVEEQCANLRGGKPFVVPRSRALLDLLAQPDLEAGIFAFVPPHAAPEVSRDLLLKMYRNFAVNIDAVAWRATRKTFASQLCPFYAYEYTVCVDPERPDDRLLVRSLGSLEDYQRGVARLEALEPTLRTRIPALVPAQRLGRLHGKTLAELDSHELQAAIAHGCRIHAFGCEALPSTIFRLTSPSLRVFYVGLTRMPLEKKLAELSQHYSSYCRNGDKYQKAFGVMRNGDVEISGLGEVTLDIIPSEKAELVEVFQRGMLEGGWSLPGAENEGRDPTAAVLNTFYKITEQLPEGSECPPSCYIGHTTATIERRMMIHREGRHRTTAHELVSGPHTVQILEQAVMAPHEALVREAELIYEFRDTAINMLDPRLEGGSQVAPATRKRIMRIRDEDGENHRFQRRRIGSCRSFLETMAAGGEGCEPRSTHPSDTARPPQEKEEE